MKTHSLYKWQESPGYSRKSVDIHLFRHKMELVGRPRSLRLHSVQSRVVRLPGAKGWWGSCCRFPLNGLSLFPRERLKRSQKNAKVEGPEPVPAETSLSAEQGTMTEVKVKTELPDDYIQEVIWQGEAKEEKKAVGKDGTGDVPAEICVVIGGVRNQQTLGECLSEDQEEGRGVWPERLASLRENFRCLAESCLCLLSSSLESSFSDVTRPHASVKPLLRSDT